MSFFMLKRARNLATNRRLTSDKFKKMIFFTKSVGITARTCWLIAIPKSFHRRFQSMLKGIPILRSDDEILDQPSLPMNYQPSFSGPKGISPVLRPRDPALCYGRNILEGDTSYPNPFEFNPKFPLCDQIFKIQIKIQHPGVNDNHAQNASQHYPRNWYLIQNHTDSFRILMSDNLGNTGAGATVHPGLWVYFGWGIWISFPT